MFGLRHGAKEGVQIFHQYHHRAVPQVSEKSPPQHVPGEVRVPAIDGLEVRLRKLRRVALGEVPVDADEQLQKAGAGFILIQPGKAESLSQVCLAGETVVDEGDEVGLSGTARTDEKQVVLVAGEHAFPQFFHGVREQPVPLHQHALQRFRVRALRGKV